MTLLISQNRCISFMRWPIARVLPEINTLLTLKISSQVTPQNFTRTITISSLYCQILMRNWWESDLRKQRNTNNLRKTAINCGQAKATLCRSLIERKAPNIFHRSERMGRVSRNQLWRVWLSKILNNMIAVSITII